MPKTALITGASGGIGRAFAEALARDGYTLTAVARSEDKLRQLTQQLGSEHDYVVADLSEAAGQDRVIARLGEQHFDLLINNAGVGIIGDFHEVPVDRTLAMLRLNIDALVRLSHAYLASARSGDALINLSSTRITSSIRNGFGHRRCS